MSEQKTVFRKLFKKEELASHKVELSLSLDFQNAYLKANSEDLKIKESFGAYLQKLKQDLKDNLTKLEYSKKLGQDLFSSAKDLGLDLNDTQLKHIKDCDFLISESEKMLSKINSLL
jgi:hypothetical protein